MNAQAIASAWVLEVVRGKDPGRHYPLARGETLIGNALSGESGIDLGDQEAGAPRRMAARQAAIDLMGDMPAVRDLNSPGGTFVNRQRLTAGQARPLQPGDVIQLGGVQLKLVESSGRHPGSLAPAPSTSSPAHTPSAGRGPGAAAPRAGQGTFLYTLKSGAGCRSWDDFLTLSAQRWQEMCEELTSGCLSAFLVSIGRTDLTPDPQTPGTADERLDAWLAGLPTTKPPKPELDVHPLKLAIRAPAGGGTTWSKVRVSNTGYRLLRSTARVEPVNAAWVTLPPEFAGRPFVTIDETELPLELRIPESLASPLSATLVIDGNGGSQRIAITLEPGGGAGDLVHEPSGAAATRYDVSLRDWIASQPANVRLWGWSVAALLLRLGIGLAAWAAGLFGVGIAGDSPGLVGPGFFLAVVGVLLGVSFAAKRGATNDAVSAGFAGGFAGLLSATILVAISRSVEAILGPLRVWSLTPLVLWAGLGAALAGLSLWLVPPRSRSEIGGGGP
jgi:pSer/pThr/pTyr-binding forkhead associated (FHA) protein